MIVKTLQIRNFKSIRNLKLDFSTFNVFIGEPNTGKSNILEALGLISNLYYYKYLHQEPKLISKDFVRYSAAYNLYYDNKISNTVKITVNDNPRTQVIVKSEEYGHIISLPIERSFINHQLIENGLVRLTEENLFINLKLKDNGSVRFPELLKEAEEFLNFAKKIKFYRYKSLDIYTENFSNFLLPPSGANQIAVIQANDKLSNYITEILTPFGLQLYLRPTERKIELVKKEAKIMTGFPLNLTAETIQRLIFLLSIIETNKNSCIVLEEPETHLFPYYTKYLAEFIALNTNNNQYFFSTHNPYFLTTLIEKIKISEISIYVTKYQNYETKVKKLSQKEIQQILDDEDPFFNIDAYF